MWIRKRAKKEIKGIAILDETTNFMVREAYKTIRTNLLFTLQNQKSGRVIITSSAPDEGKTTSCCNLGITLAQTGAKVLLIDCDLRKPLIHRCFARTGEPGLSDLLAGIKEDPFEVIQSTDYENLSILCAGTLPPNPAELLGSERMAELMIKLSQEYEYILIDTPPINLVSDALTLLSLADGVILVVRQMRTSHPEVFNALNSLNFANTKILGVILNGIRISEQDKYLKKSYKKYNGYLVGNADSFRAHI